MPKASDKLDVIVGVSPLGGNSVEGTADGMAAVRDTSIQAVPLVWDSRVKQYISEQAVEELDDRDDSDELTRRTLAEEQFRAKAGYQKG
jgi:hypothetical protein